MFLMIDMPVDQDFSFWCWWSTCLSVRISVFGVDDRHACQSGFLLLVSMFDMPVE